MRNSFALLSLAALGVSFADTLTLRNGKTVSGTYLGGTARQIRMEVNSRVESFDVSDIASLRFESEAPAAAPALRDEPRVLRPTPTAPVAEKRSTGEVPAGTAFVIRMIDSVDSEVNQLGQTFQASLDEPVTVDGRTVISRGADVVVKLVEDKQSGRIGGRTELGLALQSVKVDGRIVDITTEEVTQASESRGSKSGKVIGGGAALGAIIGAIAGGGRGAAIGAVSGAGAGTAVQVLTKGERVKIPSETRLTFTLVNPLRL